MNLKKLPILLIGIMFVFFQNFTSNSNQADSQLDTATEAYRVIPFFSCPNSGEKENKTTLAQPCFYNYTSLKSIQSIEDQVRSAGDPAVVLDKGSVYDYSIENIYLKMIEKSEDHSFIYISFYNFTRPRIARALYERAYGDKGKISKTTKPNVKIVLVLDKSNIDISSGTDIRSDLFNAINGDESPESRAVICSDKSIDQKTRNGEGKGCLGVALNHNKVMLFEKTYLPKNYIPKRFQPTDDTNNNDEVELKWAVAISSQNLTHEQMRLHQNMVVISESSALFEKYKRYIEAESENITNLSFGDDKQNQLKLFFNSEKTPSIKTILTPMKNGDKKASPLKDELQQVCVEDNCKKCEVLISVNNLSLDFFNFLISGDPKALSKKCHGNIKIVLNRRTDLLCEDGKHDCTDVPKENPELSKAVKKHIVDYKYYPTKYAKNAEGKMEEVVEVGGVHTKTILIRTELSDGRSNYKVITGSLLPTEAHINDNDSVIIKDDEKVYRAFKDVFDMMWDQAKF